MRTGSLRHGDIVEVRSAVQILATLDDRSMLDGLPFMTEMLQYCGHRFLVDKRAEKICDTIHPPGSRRLPDTVLLEDLRCDGSGHNGCQAECRLFWKEAWLRRVEPGETAPVVGEDEGQDKLAQLVAENSRARTEVDEQPMAGYRCQATELHRASRRLRTWDPRPYVREYTSGNVSFGRFLRITARAMIREPLRKLGLTSRILLPGTGERPTRQPALGLQPGEIVQVKSRGEIAATLTPEGTNRGLWFDGGEMLPFSEGSYRVRRRVTRFIDDRNGQMIELKTDCVTLDGVVCSGERSPVRWFCPRAIYPYWREAWLRRVDPGPATLPTEPPDSASPRPAGPSSGAVDS